MRTAGDRARRRRLNKLSCAGWLPHDRGFVSGLPHSKDERRSGDRLITGQEGSPPRPCLRQCARLDDWRELFFLFSSNQGLLWLALWSCGRGVSLVPAQRQIHRALRPLSASRRFCMGWESALVLDRWLDQAGDGRDKADHLAGDSGDGHDTGLARCGQPAIPRTQPDLGFPRNIAYFCGQRLETVVQLRLTRAFMR